MFLCRYGSSVERERPKLERRVRFPLSAFIFIENAQKPVEMGLCAF